MHGAGELCSQPMSPTKDDASQSNADLGLAPCTMRHQLGSCQVVDDLAGQNRHIQSSPKQPPHTLLPAAAYQPSQAPQPHCWIPAAMTWSRCLPHCYLAILVETCVAAPFVGLLPALHISWLLGCQASAGAVLVPSTGSRHNLTPATAPQQRCGAVLPVSGCA